MKSLKSDISEKDKPILVFILTAAMQVAFLGSTTVNPLLGYDFTKPKDRMRYIEKLVDILFEGALKANE